MSRIGLAALQALFRAAGLTVSQLAENAAIPGSFWGAPEAGLIGHRLYVRADTPVHSALHEACHYLCLDETRRPSLHTDAGSSDVEENAVCYLQCLLAEQLAGYSMAQCFADMDAWGYNFVLGSARAWFNNDSEDARDYLRRLVLPRLRRSGIRIELPPVESATQALA
ncbi:MAG: hypothetical protein ACPGZP_05930 [Panacagrimonas sp.]